MKQGMPKHGSERQLVIDVGLAVLANNRKEGEEYTAAEIANVCCVSHSAIRQAEQRALKKLREALRRKLQIPWRQFFQEGEGLWQ